MWRPVRRGDTAVSQFAALTFVRPWTLTSDSWIESVANVPSSAGGDSPIGARLQTCWDEAQMTDYEITPREIRRDMDRVAKQNRLAHQSLLVREQSSLRAVGDFTCLPSQSRAWHRDACSLPRD